MPYTAAGKNLMLNALRGTNPTTPITHAGLLDAAAAITAVTGTAATDVFSKTAHGLVDGDLVVLTEMSGGTGLRAGNTGNVDGLAEPLFVIAAAANTFQLSRTVGGTAANFTSDITAVTVTKLVEISGGSPAYARKAIAFNAPVEGAMDDTVALSFNVPISTVDYVSFHSALTAGTLLGIDRVTSEVYAAQGIYELTDADLDLNA